MFICHLQDLIITRNFCKSRIIFNYFISKNKFPNSINSTNIILLCICSISIVKFTLFNILNQQLKTFVLNISAV